MKFWKGNRIDGEFEMPPAEVAEKFVAWYRELPSWRKEQRLGVLLRVWLASKDGLDSVWEDEDGFDAAFDAAYDLIFGKVTVTTE